jgi:hypothetical protein
LINAGVQCAQALKTFLKFGREPIVGLNLGEEEGVATTSFGLIEDEEECCPRRLLLP